MKLPSLPYLSFSGAVITAVVLTTISAPAQRVGGQWTLEAEIYGTEADALLGAAVAGPGDLDFDGYADLLVCAPGGTGNIGVVYAYSGREHKRLWTWSDGQACRAGEALDGAGDLNGDGRPDVIVGIPQCNKIVALLHDGTVWWQVKEDKNFGTAVAGAGDVDLDGFDDVIVGYSRASPNGVQDAGSAFVYSGRDGTLLYRFDGQVAYDRLGTAVGAAGDVNADGWPDLVAGAPRADRGGFVDNGAAYVYSGRDGSLLHEFAGTAATAYFGDRVAGVGDFDGDGNGDLLVGTYRANYAGSQSGSVFAYSGRTGSLLYRLDGSQADDNFGTALDGMDDLDLDGVPDFAVGAEEAYSSTYGSGRVATYSGASGALLDVISGVLPSRSCWGCSMANAGDTDHDGFPDLLIGAKDYSQPQSLSLVGAAFLYRFDPFLYADATEISATSGVPVRIELRFPDSEAFQPYALLFSGAGTGPTTIGSIQVPLGAGPLLSQGLTGQAPPNVLGAYGTLDAKARASAGITVHPLLSAQIGRTFHMAAITYNAVLPQARRSSIAWPITVIL